jgi:hypothetical protein
MRRVTRPGVLLIAGCQSIAGLDEFQVDRAPRAGQSGAAAESGGAHAAQAGTVARRPDPTLDSPARRAERADGGVAPEDAAVHRNPEDLGPAQAGSAADAGAARSANAGMQRAAAEDDAGSDIDISAALGNTGLRVSDILGYYSGDWGQMVLRTHGDEIWGVYEYRDGTVTGRVNDEGVFLGWWSQLPSRTGLDEGEVEFRWSRVADTTIALDGRWRYGSTGDWLENWDIVRVSARSAPSHLTDRFANTDEFKRRP